MLKCARCTAPAQPGGRYCGKKCRQAAYRQRKAGGVPASASLTEAQARAATALAFEYADPPYPGFAELYADQPTYGGEVDHGELIRRLRADYDGGKLAGFALSTSSKTLLELAPHFVGLTFPVLRVGGWFKPIGVSGETKGPHSTWEPVIVVGGRRVPPGFRDWIEAEPSPVPRGPDDALRTPPARQGGSELIGRKPQMFCAWLFDMLGMVPGDTLLDTFPGSGAVTMAWRELSSRAARQLSLSLDAGDQRRVVLHKLDDEPGPGDAVALEQQATQ